MNEGETKSLHRLGWRFWFVLFAPTIITFIGTALVPRLYPKGGLSGLVFVNLCLGPAVNFVCSIRAARMVVLQRDHRGASSPQMFLWVPLFFFLNLAIVFGGCVFMQNSSR